MVTSRIPKRTPFSPIQTTKIEPGDLARLQESDRVTAEAKKAYDTALKQAQAIFKPIAEKHAKLCAYIEVKYGVGPKDPLDLKTGVITRG